VAEAEVDKIISPVEEPLEEQVVVVMDTLDQTVVLEHLEIQILVVVVDAMEIIQQEDLLLVEDLEDLLIVGQQEVVEQVDY
jgi:hypothetical protein